MNSVSSDVDRLELEVESARLIFVLNLVHILKFYHTYPT